MFRFLKVEVVHWDYWERFSLPMEANVITIVGPNGSGKTTLLDALRTLLCIDCSSGRDYKRYIRRNDKPISWLRAVVDNKRQDSGFRPFFPIMSETVTLACQISKKGGDWQRQYLLAEGDVAIENLTERGTWIGVRDYRQRLEQAGLTQAIRHVLALEQGDTDRLCQYSPRQLLELVFSVFGDQEVLDNYQQAKNEQMQIGRELEKLEDDLSRLGVRLREAEANVNSFREWESLRKEVDKLSQEILPRMELADLHEKISASRAHLLKKRSEVALCSKKFDELKKKGDRLINGIEAAKVKEQELEVAKNVASERFTLHRDAARDAEKILSQKKDLEELCRQQRSGVDIPALAQEQRDKRAKVAANDHELTTVRQQKRDFQARITALKAGEKIEPSFVQEFRTRLGKEKIAHKLLVDVVEVTDLGWQKALEGVLGQYAHIVLLTDPGDRKRAWDLGSEMRYRPFVVAERGTLPKVTPGSLLEVVTFHEPPPIWLVEQLNRIRRVETVNEGSTLSADTSWVTREGYHRERRGGHYIGVDKNKFLFGDAARKNVILEAEEEMAVLALRDDALRAENETLIRRIDEIQALLTGIDAAQQLAVRSAEFARVENEFPDLVQQAQETAAVLADCSQKLKDASSELRDLEVSKGSLDSDIRRMDEDLRKDLADLRTQKKHQSDRIIDYRNRRRPMPASWYSRQALIDLREKFDSAESVRRETTRLGQRLNEGSWVTDAQVLAVREKLQGDYSHLEETIKTRRIHHHRHLTATQDARESYINVLKATVRQYGRNVRSLGDLAGIGIEVEPPHLVNEDVALAQAGLNIKFNFDKKGMIGLNDGEASGGQQVMKSLILLVGLLMDENQPGGFVFIDEPFAHLDVFNIDKVGAFLEATKAQYVLTTPNTHNVNVFKTSDLTLVTQKRRHPDKWAQPVAFLRREKRELGR